MNICPLHQQSYPDGAECVWCARGMMPFVATNQPAPPAPVKPIKADEHVAAYTNPWGRPWFQDYMDSQPAPGAHTLEQRETGYLVTYHWEWGEMQVRGDRASAARPDILGTVVIGMNEDGDPTLSIR